MSDEANKTVPTSPEEQPQDVRKELDQESVSHQGKKVKPSTDKTEPQSYMGATDENVTPVKPPMVGASKVTQADEDEEDVNPRTELTPG